MSSYLHISDEFASSLDNIVSRSSVDTQEQDLLHATGDKVVTHVARSESDKSQERWFFDAFAVELQVLQFLVCQAFHRLQLTFFVRLVCNVFRSSGSTNASNHKFIFIPFMLWRLIPLTSSLIQTIQTTTSSALISCFLLMPFAQHIFLSRAKS